ncbi:MAG: hypothetical protein JW797_10715 [Bradymonadales bacterium]|nr:hypothetical protein [Bradymonadales bacterium]
MTLEQFEDLDQTEERLKKNLEAVVGDLLVVLRTDLSGFVTKEVKNRFIANAEFGESLTNEQLLEIKTKATQIGEEVSKAICDEMEGEWDFWFGPDVPQGEGKSFDNHLRLMERLQQIAHAAAELLEQYSFPKDEGGVYQLSYHPPAYFVNGKYAPGLAEAFWKNLNQLHEVREARREQELGRRRAVQRQRWDMVEKKTKKEP